MKRCATSCATRRCASPGDRLRQRGHDRVPLRPRHAGVVLHRDESAHPGRAHGHRSHHRHRPRALANPRRARRGAARTGTRLPPQDEIPRNGFAVQCRVTTEDPENKFTPNYGKILTYRSPADSASGSTAAWATRRVITPFYDSLLVKVTASGQTFEMALQRMDRALREFRIRGVKTNIPFLENVIDFPNFRSRPGDDDADRHHAAAFRVSRPAATARPSCCLPRQRHRQRQSARQGLQTRPKAAHRAAARARPQAGAAAGTRQLLLETRAEKFAEWTLKQKRLLVTDTTFRDAHQSLLATRVRTYDMLAVADAWRARTPEIFSLEMWGGATFDTSMRFLNEDPWQRCALLRERVPNICFQMLLSRLERRRLHELSEQRRRRLRQARRGERHRYFPHLRFAELLPNMKVAMEAVQETHAHLRGGDLLHRRHPRSQARRSIR
jgi:pyruvate carboxylase